MAKPCTYANLQLTTNPEEIELNVPGVLHHVQ